MAQAEAKPFIANLHQGNGTHPNGLSVDKRIWYKLGAKERYNLAHLI